jgi:hypothetical protein
MYINFVLVSINKLKPVKACRGLDENRNKNQNICSPEGKGRNVFS